MILFVYYSIKSLNDFFRQHEDSIADCVSCRTLSMQTSHSAAEALKSHEARRICKVLHILIH